MKKIIKYLLSRYYFNYKKNFVIDKYRMKKMQFKSIEKGIRLSEDLSLFNTQNIKIGEYVFIGKQAYIDAVDTVEIGSGTMIGPRLTIISSNHNYDGEELSSIPYDNKIYKRPVIIKDNVWIGSNVCILPGVEIGEGAVIGMGTIVSKNIPPYAIAVGNPVKIIKYRNKDIYLKLKHEDKIYNKEYAGKGFIYV